MDDPFIIFLKIILVIFLVLLNGFFVAAEFAMVKVRSTRIEQLVTGGNRRARIAQKLTMNLDGYLSATQLGITLASLGLGWVGEPAVAAVIEPLLERFGVASTVIHAISFTIAFSIITFLHIVFGELAPKSLAIQKAECTTMWTAAPLIFFYRMMYPFIWFLNGAAGQFLRLIGIQPVAEHEAAHTEDEIRILMKQSHKSGLIDNTELTLVDNIFEFAERNVREIMVPRTQMICLYTGYSDEQNLEIAIQEKHTRYPVCDPDKDNISGFVHIKDFLTHPLDEGEEKLSSIIRNIIKVPESMQISSLLKKMQKNKVQMAIVIDEFGGTSGLVTIEDILEEIVGEIQDEFDEERPPVEEKGEGIYSVDGKLLIDEVNDMFGIDLDTEDYDTIGGWLQSHVDMPPRTGQKIMVEDCEFSVEETDRLQVTRVGIRRLIGHDAENMERNE